MESYTEQLAETSAFDASVVVVEPLQPPPFAVVAGPEMAVAAGAVVVVLVEVAVRIVQKRLAPVACTDSE